MRVVNNRAMHSICVQDMLAVRLARGGLDLAADYFPDILDDSTYRDIRSRIDVDVDLDLEKEQPTGRGAVVTIVTDDGASHTDRVDHPRGHSLGGPVGWDDLRVKWRTALPGVDVDRATRLAARIDELDDIDLLTTVFAAC